MTFGLNSLLLYFRRDPLVNMNFAIFLYNQGERKGAAKQFTQFEQKFLALKQSNPNDIDQEVC